MILNPWSLNINHFEMKGTMVKLNISDILNTLHLNINNLNIDIAFILHLVDIIPWKKLKLFSCIMI